MNIAIDLQEKILNRDTEIQRSWDLSIENERLLIKEIENIEVFLIGKKRDLRSQKEHTQKILKRAEELNCNHIL